MVDNIKLTIGNVSLSIYPQNHKWFSILKSRYGIFAKNRLEHGHISNYKISLLNKKDIDFKSQKPIVKKTKDKIEIFRYDFYSISKDYLDSTVLYSLLNIYSFDSWLRIFLSLLLLKHNSILLHSAGIIYNNHAYIFPGISGAGKSTLIGLLGKDIALNDEIVIVKYISNNLFVAYPTPFWGGLEYISKKYHYAKIKKMFFLKKNSNLNISKIDKLYALRKILRSVIFFSNAKKDLNKILTIATKAVSNIPSYNLLFPKYENKTKILNLITTGKDFNYET